MILKSLKRVYCMRRVEWMEKQITFIFINVFDSDISFLINKKPETIEKYTALFDEKFFNLLLIFPLLIIIFFFDNKIKKNTIF